MSPKVCADAKQGFAYGKRLAGDSEFSKAASDKTSAEAYDWRFWEAFGSRGHVHVETRKLQVGPSKTKVELDMLFQAF